MKDPDESTTTINKDRFMLYTTLEDTPEGLTVYVPSMRHESLFKGLKIVEDAGLPPNEFRFTDGKKIIRIIIAEAK